MSTLRAAHAALAADVPLASIVDDRIYEHVPARAESPYIVLGELVSRPWDTASDRGRLDDLTVHVWSAASRRSEADDAAARIFLALRFEALQPFFAAHHPARLVNVVAGAARTERLPERDLVHATLRFRITSEDIQ